MIREAYIDKDIFRLTGEMHGERVDFSVRSDRLGAFPITPGDHFDVYHDGRLIYVYPEPDEREAVRWVCFLDKLNSDRKKETVSAVSD